MMFAGVSTHAGEIDTAFLRNLPEADVVILGEVHDNPVHHANQADAVRAIAPTAVVFEMLTAMQAAKIGIHNRNDDNALADDISWNVKGWGDFDQYYQIIAASPAPIYGGGLERGLVRRAVTEGAAGVFGDAAGEFGLIAALNDDEQALRENNQREAHCNALPENLLAGMVQAQRLRDANLARAVLKALDEHGGPVVLITGNGHTRRDWGVPAALNVARSGLRITALAQLESYDKVVDTPFDYFLVTAPTPREDPCAAFK